MLQLQGRSKNPQNFQNDAYFFNNYSNIVRSSSLAPPRCLFPVKILKAPLSTFILATCSAHRNLLDSMTLTMLYKR